MSEATISRSGSETRHRSEHAATRLTVQEKAGLTAFARSQGMSLGELLRVGAIYMKTMTEAGQ